MENFFLQIFFVANSLTSVLMAKHRHITFVSAASSLRIQFPSSPHCDKKSHIKELSEPQFRFDLMPPNSRLNAATNLETIIIYLTLVITWKISTLYNVGVAKGEDQTWTTWLVFCAAILWLVMRMWPLKDGNAKHKPNGACPRTISSKRTLKTREFQLMGLHLCRQCTGLIPILKSSQEERYQKLKIPNSF